jgi:hypothetical protein
MKQRLILFRRAGSFYSEDTTTRKQLSLRTKDQAEAITLLNTKNEAIRNLPSHWPKHNKSILIIESQHSRSAAHKPSWLIFTIWQPRMPANSSTGIKRLNRQWLS